MSQDSIVRIRSADWWEVLDFRGWVPLSLTEPPDGETEAERQLRVEMAEPVLGKVALRACRSKDFGEPLVTVSITEIRLPGDDPDEVSLEEDGCYLHKQSWHAQFGVGLGEEGGERHDLDRKKPREKWIHRHPLGKPNNCRVAQGQLLSREVWLEHVELLMLKWTP